MERGQVITMNRRHECVPEMAARMREWFAERGGIAVWSSVNLSNLGSTWTTPARDENGQPFPKPSWESASQPAEIITDPSQVDVVTRREVKRFRVAIRRGAHGFTMKLTDASARKLRASLAKAGPEAAYRFDYFSQEAVISVPDKRVPLSEWSES
jgi:hypothetical protein